MKKTIYLILAGLIMLTGCKNNPQDLAQELTTEESIVESSVSETTETTPLKEVTTTKPQTETVIKTQTETTTVTTEPEVTTKPPTQKTTKPEQTSAKTTTTATQTTVKTTKLKETATSTVKEEKEVEEMPEIVFIVLANSYSSKNVVYGYFINNKGEVRYFEFFDEEETALALEKKNEGYFNWLYTENFIYIDFSANLLRRMYKTIIDISVDTGDRVEIDKLTELYNQLLTVDLNSEIEIESDDYSLNVDFIVKHSYGIRRTTSNKDEIVLLRGIGEVFFTNTDTTADALCEKIVYSIFPSISIDYVPKLLQEQEN